MKLFLLYLVASIAILPAEAQRVLQGQVYDLQLKTAISYATITLPASKLGIVADESGSFKLLLIDDVKESDTIVISSVAHLPKKMLVKEANATALIYLDRKVPELKRAVIKPFLHSGTLGKIVKSRAYCTGWTDERVGGEAGKIFVSEHTLFKVEKLRFHVFSSFDTAWFRVHIRNVKDGIPAEELLNEEIIIRVVKREGISEHDLNRYDLVFDEPSICVSLELLRLANKPPGRPRALFMVTGQQPGNSYLRPNLTAQWIHKASYELAMDMKIRY